ncbi:CBO0543 family protein [Sutcliffiella deserti]|uniref:CBO0543 family protein n=1 Tax=Sutcliffiella deserti TaxID=2875501 RepID=UPI001CC10875|nr:CBO0543 family protein [Sutcliffiella deserti]
MRPYHFPFYSDLIILNYIADPRWWLLFLSIFLPWVIWWIFADKNRLYELLIYGMLWAVIATWLDLIGTSNGLWEYPYNLYNKVPTLLPADLSVIPVMFMLLYQYLSNWKKFLLGSVLVSSLLSFVLEPLFIKFSMLNLINWTHFKSLFSFVILALLTKSIMSGLEKLKSF